MTENELLSAISDLMNKKLDDRLRPVNECLDILKFNQEHMTGKLRGIEATMNYNDFHFSQDIRKLQEDMPRLQKY